MQVSTKGRYALRFLLDLAQRESEGPVPLKAVAERQGISKKYLEHVISLLSPTGMLRITRGSLGGYQLAENPSDVTVADVLRITEGGLAPVSCLEGEPAGCERREECMTLEVWEGLERVMTDYLEAISLQDLLDKHGPTIEYFI